MLSLDTNASSLDAIAKIKFSALAGIDADKCPAAHRLCKILYKEEKIDGVKTGRKRASLGAFIPMLSLDGVLICEDKKLQGWMEGKMMDVQDKMVRTRLDVQGCEDKCYVPSLDEIIAACHKETETDGRRAALSAEAIKEWFIASGMRDALREAFATKLACTMEDMRVRKVVDAYGDNMALLAGKAQMPDAVLENLTKAMNVLASAKEEVLDSDMFVKVLERIEVKGQRAQVDLMAL